MTNCSYFAYCRIALMEWRVRREKLNEKKYSKKMRIQKHEYADAECPVHQSCVRLSSNGSIDFCGLNIILIYIFMVAFKSLKNMLITLVWSPQSLAHTHTHSRTHAAPNHRKNVGKINKQATQWPWLRRNKFHLNSLLLLCMSLHDYFRARHIGRTRAQNTQFNWFGTHTTAAVAAMAASKDCSKWFIV